MGFFSKIFKSVGKVFKKIGKGIKSAFKKFGKFMNKIGILGQVAMFFIMPAIGNALLGAAGSAAVGVAGTAGYVAAVPASGLLGGALGSVGVAAGKAAVWVGQKIATVKSVFSNITGGVMETLGNFAKTATNKLANFVGMDNVFADAAQNFFGPTSGSTGTMITNSAGEQVADSAFSRSFGADARFQNLTKGSEFFKGVKESRALQVEGLKADIVTNLPDAFKAPPVESSIKAATAPADLVSSSSSMTGEQIKSFGADLSDEMLNDYKFKLEGVAGDQKFTFGDRIRFMSPESLTELGKVDDINYFNNFKTSVIDAATQRASGEQGIGALYDTLNSAQYEAVSVPKPESLLASVGNAVAGLPKKAIEEGTKFLNDPFGDIGTKATGALQTKVLQGIGLENKPVYNQGNTIYADVPTFQTADVGSYGAPETMNARAFEQQVTSNPMAYGYTAFQYGNYMSQYGITA